MIKSGPIWDLTWCCCTARLDRTCFCCPPRGGLSQSSPRLELTCCCCPVSGVGVVWQCLQVRPWLWMHVQFGSQVESNRVLLSHSGSLVAPPSQPQVGHTLGLAASPIQYFSLQDACQLVSIFHIAQTRKHTHIALYPRTTKSAARYLERLVSG